MQQFRFFQFLSFLWSWCFLNSNIDSLDANLKFVEITWVFISIRILEILVLHFHLCIDCWIYVTGLCFLQQNWMIWFEEVKEKEDVWRFGEAFPNKCGRGMKMIHTYIHIWLGFIINLVRICFYYSHIII